MLENFLTTGSSVCAGVNKFGNSYTYNRTRLSPASYELRVTVNKNLEDESIFKRSFDIFSDPMSCGVYLRDEDGVVVDKTTGVLTIDFGASGLYDSFSCTTNDKPTVCKSCLSCPVFEV